MIEKEKAISDFIYALLSIDRIKSSDILTQIYNDSSDNKQFRKKKISQTCN